MTWRPIDTAPGDSDNLLLVTDGDYVTLAWFSDVDDGGWIDACGGDDGHGLNPQPVAWQPKPEPPAPIGAADLTDIRRREADHIAGGR